jgi:hypothetical protein
MNTCEFCNKTLLNKNNLTRHLSSCKIKKQKESDKSEEPKDVSCEFCNKVLSKQTNLNRHLLICKIREQLKIDENKSLKEENLVLKEKLRCLQEQLNTDQKNFSGQNISLREENITLIEKVKCLSDQNGKLTDQNKSLSDQMFQLANKPTTTNNNKQIVKKQFNLINRLAPYDISEQLVQQIVDKEYTEDDFRQGPGRLASFVATKIATNQEGKKKIVCTDYARRRFKHLNVDGSDVVEDIGAINLCKTITKPMKQVISTTYDKIKEELIDEVDIDSYRSLYMSNTDRLRQPEFVSDLAKHMINPDDESNITGEEEEEMLLS